MTTQTNCPDCGVAVGHPHANKCETAERLSPLAVYVGEDDIPTERMTLRELSDYLRSLPQSVMDMPGTLIVHCSDGDISPVLATPQTEAEIDEGERDSLWNEDDVFGTELHRIARECIQNNWHRTDYGGGGWHYFSDEELAAINERTGNDFDYGYCFLDEDGGTEGLIRLWVGQANPKWSFWKQGDSLKIELA
jgi:hypothetical protein